MQTPDNVSEDDNSISPYAETTHFSSEWNKFLLIIWKNIRIVWGNWDNYFMTVFMPILFCIVLVSLRMTMPVVHHSVETYPILDLPNYWQNVMKIIDGRRVNIGERKWATHNPFIPEKIVGYAPNDKAYGNVMQETINSLQSVDVNSYSTCDDLRKAIIEENLFAGVCFESCFDRPINGNGCSRFGELYPNHLKYRLIFPYAGRIYNDTFIGMNWYTNSLFHFVNRTDQRNVGVPDGGYVGYIREGFAPLQNSISLSYFKLVANSVNRSDFQIPEIKMSRLPSKEFHRNNIIELVDYSIAMMIVFGNFYPAVIFITKIIAEKDGKLKTYSKIMGLNSYLHYLGWIVNFLLRSIISSVMIILVLKVKWSSSISIMENSSFCALLLVVAVYNVTTICFILMLASIYTCKISSVVGTSFLWFSTFLPYIMSLSSDHNGLTWTFSIFMFLFHNTALGLTFENILELELFGEGFQFNNLFNSQIVATKISIGSLLLLMLLQSFMYTCVSLYVEEIMPGNFGLAKRWNFLFTFKKDSPGETMRPTIESLNIVKEGTAVVTTSRPIPFIYEIGSINSVVVVHIRNVSKDFGDGSVLKNINLQLRENEITVLMGHNGSGKTTLLSMISGLRSITKGNIMIEGFDVTTDRRYACSSLGLCMGDTVLYPDLTVEDQIRFFCYLKGLPGAEVAKEVDYYLKATQLHNYRLKPTKLLPLGVRQQLAVCCALSGQSRIVLLDDPTIHMDLISQTMIYQLLDREKLDRTILVTATSARVLEHMGDRVVILSNGEMQCDGSPVFIKKMYGQAYRLIINKKPECKIEAIINKVREYVPNITPICTLCNEISFALEESNRDIFNSLTDDLESHMSELYIVTVTLRPMYIDDIFFKLAASAPSYDNRARLVEIMNGQSNYPEENKHLKFMEIEERLTGLPKALQNIKSLLRQRIITAKVHGILYFRRLFYPPLFVIIAFTVSSFNFYHKPQNVIDFNLNHYLSSVTLIERRFTTETTEIEGGNLDIMTHYKDLIFWLGIQHKVEDTNGQLLSDYYLQKHIGALNRMDQNHHVGVTFSDTYIIAWFNNVALHTVPLSLNLVHNAIFRAIYGEKCSIGVELEPLNNMENYMDGLLRLTISTSNVLAITIAVCICCLWNAKVCLFVRDIQTGYHRMQILAGVKSWEYWLANVCYDTLIILVVCIIITMTIMAIQSSLNVPKHIYVWYVVILTLCGWTVYSMNYTISLFCEDPITAFATTMSLHVFGILSFCHIIQAFEKGFVNTTKSHQLLYLNFIPLFAFCSAISTIYYNAEFSRICREENIKFTSIYVEHCNAIPNCCRTFDILDSENGIIMELMIIISTICICWWIIIVRNMHFCYLARDIPRDDTHANLRDHNRRHDNQEENRFGGLNAFREQIAVENMHNDELRRIPLVCDRVGKNYGRKIAVDRQSFMLNRFNCFGILPVSGSGATTLLDIITGFQKRSYGRILIKGHNVTYNFYLVQQLVGYGRQDMINFREYTVEDIMCHMCCLHSYPGKYIEEICLNLAKVFGLYPCYKKHLSRLSRGSLHRLNCAVAIMGNPKIIILDMAIAGIDSAGKRDVWNILNRMQCRGATILTVCTNLSDCNRFCSRVGFMANGRFFVITEPWNLEKLYAKNHLLKVRFSRSISSVRASFSNNYLYAARLNKFIDFIHNEFPNSVLKEHQGNIFLFLIPVRGNTISRIFTTLTRNAFQLSIEDFELIRCTLSQSFIDFWTKESTGQEPNLQYMMQSHYNF